MKTIFWNIRGLANSSTQRTLGSLVKKYSPDFLFLAEPMTVITTIKQSFWRSIGMNLIGVNDRGQRLPNIWLFCSANVSSPLVVSSSSQHLFLQFNVGGVLHGMVFVYAATTVVKRRSLWQSLALVCSAFSGPLLILGDFNAVLGAHEKFGGNLPRLVSCDEFLAMVDTCGLLHIDLKGSPFTWTNGRALASHIEMLLDRCFCSLPWLDTWPVTSCSTLVKHCSDHNPLLVAFDKFSSQGPSPFRFQPAWVQHPQFLSMVKSAWSSFTVSGCPQYILQQKLKLLKVVLKDWNHSVFGNVDLNVDLARANLEEIQLDISLNGITEDCSKKEVEAHNVLAKALLIQNHFWSSKAREKWVRDGDRNTGYFQRIAKIRRARSFLSHLRIGTDIQTYLNFLRQHVVDHFTTAFSDDGSSVDTGLVSNLIPCLVSVAENDSLTIVPSPDEIKLVVFSMDPDSAPGPDGFGGHFYRACWDFIGSDVINAVRYFFEFGYILPNLNCSFVALLPKSALPRRPLISKWLGVSIGALPFTYLGVPIFSGRPKRLHFQGLVDKVKSRFSQWRGTSLSMAGRVTFVKSVINSMLSHSFFVYAWPQTVLMDLRRWVRNFIWSGNVLTCGYSIVAWVKCCAPIDEGGSQIDFWHQNWLGSSVIELLSVPPSLAKTLQTKVSSFIVNGRWVCPMDLQVFCQPIWNGVVKVALPCKAGLEDKLIWRAAKDGNLSVALAYELKRTHFPRVPWARFVWNSCFRPRNSMIL
ncbi:hypothetical protein M0R45_036636 [Rubus argutus]|uniref:Endonuclease/exonuclease/phosphatase domain-containing protein n=1 Tax=Rubus argutus TaxID=59490 RepID=A0AAW1VY57_RUBAR